MTLENLKSEHVCVCVCVLGGGGFKILYKIKMMNLWSQWSFEKAGNEKKVYKTLLISFNHGFEFTMAFNYLLAVFFLGYI